MTASPGLPFARRPFADHVAATRKVYAWWHLFPRSFENRGRLDKMDTHNLYRNPYSTGYKATGGFTRDRPLTRRVSTASDGEWQLEDARVDIRNAIDAGIDGFIFNRLGSSDSSTSTNHPFFVAIFAAAAEFPGFKVIPCYDGVATNTELGTTIQEKAQAAADYMAGFKANPAWAKDTDGAFWFGGYEPAQIENLDANEFINKPPPTAAQMLQARQWWDAFKAACFPRIRCRSSCSFRTGSPARG